MNSYSRANRWIAGGCHLSLEERPLALVCFGYPLQSAGKSRALRDEVLLALRAPILFIQGTRDTLCPLELLDEVRKIDGTEHLARGRRR